LVSRVVRPTSRAHDQSIKKTLHRPTDGVDISQLQRANSPEGQALAARALPIASRVTAASAERAICASSI
jgi:hypothetical protein